MTVWLEIQGEKRRVDLPSSVIDGDVSGETKEYLVDGKSISADARLLQPEVMSLVVEGRQYRCVLDGSGVLIDGRRFEFEMSDPRSLQGRRSAGGSAAGPRPVKAPMSGRVVRVLVAVGDDVAEQQGAVVIEAMKMQNELKSPKSGRVIRVAVTEGDTVGTGDVLVVVE